MKLPTLLRTADPGGSSAVDMAVIVKLTRVALLVPVCFVVAKMVNAGTKNRFSWAELPVPWFIFGFLATSAINSFGIIPTSVTDFLVICAYFLIAMSMGGLGLNVHLPSFGKMGGKPFLCGVNRFCFPLSIWSCFSTFVSFSRLRCPRHLDL